MTRVLIIEDEKALRQSLVRGLAEEGYDVTEGATAADALHLALADPPDIVLLDRMLPDGDGLDTVRALRDAGRQEPILIITAKDAVTDRITGLDVGADDYLIKPFAFGELLARIRALLRRHRQPPETVLRVADLEFDIQQRVAKRGGVATELTPRQAQVLMYLMQHAYHPVSRESLVQDVWKQETAVWTNVVEVLINQLRRKIERPGLPPILRTIRGQGYCLGESE